MTTLAIPKITRDGYIRIRSRLANMRKTGERIAVEVGRTGVGLLGSGGMGMINGYFNNPNVGGARVDALGGTVIKAVSLFLGEIGGPLLGALGDSMIWTGVASFTTRKGLEAAAEANNTDPMTILQRREEGKLDDGSIDTEAEAA